MKFRQVTAEDGSWDDLCRQWDGKCREHGGTIEDFGPIDIFTDLVQRNKKDAGVFAVVDDHGEYLAACQLNVTPLPGFPKPVLRVRHITICPRYDFEDVSVEEYGKVLATTFVGITFASKEPYASTRIHIHLKSPADRQFFALAGQGLEKHGLFKSAVAKGMWLYLEK